MIQQHLSYKEMTDFGCFYTPEKFVRILVEMLKSNIQNLYNYTILDSSCGYGCFLNSLCEYKTIGCDIDEKAIETACLFNPNAKYFVKNTLKNFSLKSIEISDNDKLIIIGNPPYNDTTSKVKNNIKKDKPCEIDDDLKTRDLGISFMLSYNKLKADYVAILHPLSYMIKNANYRLLEPFYKNYKLLDHYVINSQEFDLTSKSRGFPIIIALYKRDINGMTYNDILNLTFKTINNEFFNLKLDFIDNYIKKYPDKRKKANDNDILFFTMRDINALNRSRTFINYYSDNAIIIDKNLFPYYCYVDNFKDYIKYLPYYYGNFNVFIDNKAFLEIKDIFITKSIEKHPFLKDKDIKFNYNNNFILIDDYFKNLFCLRGKI